MFSFEFLSQMKNYVKIYKEFPFPAMLCDLSFQVFWSNPLAKTYLPHLGEDYQLSTLFSELDFPSVIALLEKNGSYTVGNIFPLSGISASLFPLYYEENLLGIVVLFLEKDPVQWDPDYRSRTVSVLTDNLRLALHDLFAEADKLSIKAGLAGADWAIPHLSEINMDAYQVLRVTSNVAAYSQLQNQPLLPEYSSFDLAGWLREVFPVVKSLATASGIPIRFHLPENELVLAVDSQWFQTAFFNLLHNSLYYTTPHNEIDLTVRSEGDQVTIILTDRGQGFPSPLIPQVFLPYFSQPPGGKPVGVGLGLTLAQRVVVAHQGTIEIESSPGEGTTVTIQLPEGTFSRSLPLRQGEISQLKDRFSPLYVGLTSAVQSPYRAPKTDE